jgi:hypothetical protein
VENAESIAVILRAVAAVLWPVTILVLILMLRKNLAGLVDRIVKAKGPGFELEVAQLAVEVAELQEDPTVSDPIRDRLEDVERRLAAMAVASREPVTWGQLSGATPGLLSRLAAKPEPDDETSLRKAAIRRILQRAADEDKT